MPYLGTVPDFQREILEDGVVTTAEYERAVHAEIQCINDHGIKTNGPVWVRHDSALMFLVVSNFIGDPATDEVTEECSRLFSDAVEVVYVEEHTPTDFELREEVAAYRECLIEMGLPDVDESTTGRELQLAAARWSVETGQHDCVGLDPYAYEVPTELMH
jgi:hypothetical protein